MKLALCFWMLVCSLIAVPIDRIVMVVAGQVITELQLEEDLRVAAFLNGETGKQTDEQRRQVAARLIEQTLLKREMSMSHYPEASAESVEKALSQIQQRYASAAAFYAALASYSLSPEILKNHLSQQITTVRFISYRFRPDLGLSETDLQSYYERQSAKWKQQHPGAPAPSFEKSKAALHDALLESRTDEALSDWISEIRKQVQIRYLDRSLRPRTP